MFAFCMYVMLLTLSPYTPTYRDRVSPPGTAPVPHCCMGQLQWKGWGGRNKQYFICCQFIPQTFKVPIKSSFM